MRTGHGPQNITRLRRFAVGLIKSNGLSRQVLETRYGRELWRHCLAFAFLLLVAESLVARGRLRP